MRDSLRMRGVHGRGDLPQETMIRGCWTPFSVFKQLLRPTKLHRPPSSACISPFSLGYTSTRSRLFGNDNRHSFPSLGNLSSRPRSSQQAAYIPPSYRTSLSENTPTTFSPLFIQFSQDCFGLANGLKILKIYLYSCKPSDRRLSYRMEKRWTVKAAFIRLSVHLAHVESMTCSNSFCTVGFGSALEESVERGPAVVRT